MNKKTKQSSKQKENNKRQLFIIGVVILLIIIFISILSLNLIPDNKSEKEEKNNSNQAIIYNCEKLVEETNDSNNYSIINLTVVNDKITEVLDATKIVYKNADLFNMLSSSEVFTEGKIVDNESKSFTIKNEVITQNFVADNYPEYKEFLTYNEYTCN